MVRLAAFVLVLSLGPSQTPMGSAQDGPLVCFGTEPFWSLDLTEAGAVRYSRPGTGDVVFRGAEITSPVRGERLWRGRAGAGDLVVFIAAGSCSDGMSDTTHPASVRVSTPDGAFLAGCCRVPTSPSAATPLVGPVWTLVSLTGHDDAALEGLGRPVSARFREREVSGSTGCNGFGGTYSVEGDRVTFGPLAGTMMACPEPAMSIENAVRKALTGSVPYTIAGNRLTFTAASGVTLVFEKTER